jgi:hypothetical protein
LFLNAESSRVAKRPRDLLFARAQRLAPVIPIKGKFFPRWVGRFDKRYFLLASPGFDFFLTGDRGLRRTKVLEVNQPVNLVAPGESIVLAYAMLPDAAFQMIRDAAIENARATCEDVYEE